MAFCRKGGYRPELAWTCCDYAIRLGMRPLMERVLSRREILKA